MGALDPQQDLGPSWAICDEDVMRTWMMKTLVHGHSHTLSCALILADGPAWPHDERAESENDHVVKCSSGNMSLEVSLTHAPHATCSWHETRMIPHCAKLTVLLTGHGNRSFSVSPNRRRLAMPDVNLRFSVARMSTCYIQSSLTMMTWFRSVAYVLTPSKWCTIKWNCAHSLQLCSCRRVVVLEEIASYLFCLFASCAGTDHVGTRCFDVVIWLDTRSVLTIHENICFGKEEATRAR